MKFNIENYDNMTAEEKVAALEAYEGAVSKDVFDKTSSELAAAKKALKAKMTEEEAAKAAIAEELAAAQARVKELEYEKTVNGYVNSYLAMGYDEKLAKSSAEALAKGDMDVVFSNQKTHAENREKAYKAELLKQTPQPPQGDPNTGVTKAEFAKMNLIEKQKFASENPELYASYYSKEAN